MSAGGILIVDDSPHDLDLAIGILSAHGYETRVASTGRRALAAASAQTPELILLDITLPDLDGYEVCKRLRESGATARVPIIFISSRDGAMDKVHAFEIGGADYVTKPFEASELIARVENHLKMARLQRELERQNAELSLSREAAISASRAKSVFLATMSHELRTPLNGILGFAQLLKRDTQLTASQLETLEIITQSGRHLLRLINDVLAITRLEAGNMTLDIAPFDIRDVLADVAETFRERARAKSLKLDIAVDSDSPQYVLGDRSKILQILVKLVGNAIKFTSTGSVLVKASWRSGERPRGVLRIEVRDTGEGIPSESIAHVFEPFVQAVSSDRLKEGTGLGLAICHEYIELMHGSIAISSELGSGSTVEVELPLVESAGDYAAPPPEPSTTSESEPTGLSLNDVRGRLGDLPPFILSSLRHSVLLGDLDAAADIVESVAVLDEPLADELRRLVRGYQLDELFALVEDKPRPSS